MAWNVNSAISGSTVHCLIHIRSCLLIHHHDHPTYFNTRSSYYRLQKQQLITSIVIRSTGILFVGIWYLKQ
jgi:hypothetical protein